jgi:glucose-1-phosphate cytidylyltransferase
MKVVLFCGGLGTRLKEHSETIPKPMVEIGYRPIMWHLMRYYAHYGHKDFILCLGYRGDAIKHYFLNYNECVSNDFVYRHGGREIEVVNNDISDWTITFVDTGLHSNIGQRLRAVALYLDGEEAFMANYADGLADLPLDEYEAHFRRQGRVASFLCVKPSQTFHIVSLSDDNHVNSIQPVQQAGLLINGGFFIFRHEIFDYMREGEELVVEPFQRLIAADQLAAYRNPGFWACMDTLKEKMMFDEMYARGDTPWAVWEHGRPRWMGQARSDQAANNGHASRAEAPVVRSA